MLSLQASACWRPATSSTASGGRAAATAPAAACMPTTISRQAALQCPCSVSRMCTRVLEANSRVGDWKRRNARLCLVLCCPAQSGCDRYHGDWEGGVRGGQGTCEYANGDIYQGVLSIHYIWSLQHLQHLS